MGCKDQKTLDKSGGSTESCMTRAFGNPFSLYPKIELRNIKLKRNMYKYIKRFIDFMIALVALIILFVPLIIVATL